MNDVFVAVGASAIATALTVSGWVDEAFRWIGGLDRLQSAGLFF
jgi:16S rRNA C1402 (ribose-2'-O) methylase RsmI